MIYELTASGTFTSHRSPGETTDRTGTYRVESLFPIGAQVATHQLFVADAKQAGFSPSGPIEVSTPSP